LTAAKQKDQWPWQCCSSICWV